jgi:cysteine desulfurase
MRPLLRGGGQERGRRAGTENVPAIAGFGAVTESWRREAPARQRHLSELRQQLEAGVEQFAGAVINGAAALRAPHIVNVSVPGVRAESLALQLDLQGIAVGTGSACASGAIEPSHVLQAMGLSREAARSSLRISLGIQNTREEIAEFLEVLSSLLKKAKVA